MNRKPQQWILRRNDARYPGATRLYGLPTKLTVHGSLEEAELLCALVSGRIPFAAEWGDFYVIDDNGENDEEVDEVDEVVGEAV